MIQITVALKKGQVKSSKNQQAYVKTLIRLKEAKMMSIMLIDDEGIYCICLHQCDIGRLVILCIVHEINTKKYYN